MPIYWIILVSIGIGVSILGQINQRAEVNAKSADVTTIARNLLIYRNALAEYAYTNKSVSGPVPDSALALPAWYYHLPGINGYVLSGASYSYYSSPPEGLVAELAKLTGSSAAVGYVQAGKLITPSVGATGVVIPSVIPNGAAIAFQ